MGVFRSFSLAAIMSIGMVMVIIIVDEPTRGIDIGAKAEVHALLARLARDGMGVIVISSDLPRGGVPGKRHGGGHQLNPTAELHFILIGEPP